jgi:hypothetical protein
MLLTQNGFTAFTRRGFQSALFSALLAFALFDSEAASAQEVKQIKLTEKHIQGFMGASKDMASLYDGVNPDKPDPKIEARVEAIAKRNGFASLAEYEDVATNISMIMSAIDPQTKKFTEPPEQIRKQITALKADKSIPEGEKKDDLEDLEAALKTARPIRFKENVALVLKYFDKLAPLMQEDVNSRPAD